MSLLSLPIRVPSVPYLSLPCPLRRKAVRPPAGEKMTDRDDFTAAGNAAHNRWRIWFAHRDPVEIYCLPPETEDEVLRKFRDAEIAEPAVPDGAEGTP